jgi:hypothetical protein
MVSPDSVGSDGTNGRKLARGGAPDYRGLTTNPLQYDDSWRSVTGRATAQTAGCKDLFSLALPSRFEGAASD